MLSKLLYSLLLLLSINKSLASDALIPTVTLIGIEKIAKLNQETLKKFPVYKNKEGLNKTYLVNGKDLLGVKGQTPKFLISKYSVCKDLSALVFTINQKNEQSDFANDFIEVTVGLEKKELKLKPQAKAELFEHKLFEVNLVDQSVVITGNYRAVLEVKIFEGNKELVKRSTSYTDERKVVTFKGLSPKSTIHISFFDKYENMKCALPSSKEELKGDGVNP